MKKNVLVRLMSALLCVCLLAGTLAGCSGNKAKTDKTGESAEDVAASEEIPAEALEELTNGYDPEVDTNLDAERSDSGDASLAGAVITINGEKVTFSNSKLIADYKISPNKNNPNDPNTPHRNHKIDTITIHCSAGVTQVYAIANLYSKSATEASVNYAIGSDGKILMILEEKDRSWASSNSANDNRAVTIEVASEVNSPYAVTDEAYKALIKLVTDICQRNNIEKLVWSEDSATRIKHLDGANMTVHRDFANKACPGDYLYSRMGDIASQVNKNLGVE